ncbi:hypothetical protein EVAR_57785_1 [Eumeta japonica]|uniref:Uncharacterized protein n=1 Tax=Eumeta variegata TaxID=151549 RepID=A0A4C1Y924_EUMVA|nr:hypothetical protein EVAR_57785_1 [Eumeta japonica]
MDTRNPEESIDFLGTDLMEGGVTHWNSYSFDEKQQLRLLLHKVSASILRVDSAMIFLLKSSPVLENALSLRTYPKLVDNAMTSVIDSLQLALNQRERLKSQVPRSAHKRIERSHASVVA